MIRFFFSALLLAACAGLLVTAQAPESITIRAGKIVSVGKATGSVTYDLSKYTLLPGFIDTHVHILWHFGKDGRFDNTGETPDDRIKAGIENARVTVVNGFTTVQSVGERADLDLRAALTKDNLPG